MRGPTNKVFRSPLIPFAWSIAKVLTWMDSKFHYYLTENTTKDRNRYKVRAASIFFLLVPVQRVFPGLQGIKESEPPIREQEQ